jgi:hypothetical protein
MAARHLLNPCTPTTRPWLPTASKGIPKPLQSPAKPDAAQDNLTQTTGHLDLNPDPDPNLTHIFPFFVIFTTLFNTTPYLLMFFISDGLNPVTAELT